MGEEILYFLYAPCSYVVSHIVDVLHLFRFHLQASDRQGVVRTDDESVALPFLFGYVFQFPVVHLMPVLHRLLYLRIVAAADMEQRKQFREFLLEPFWLGKYYHILSIAYTLEILQWNGVHDASVEKSSAFQTYRV